MIENLISKNHEISWKSESLDSIENVEIICLTEVHNQEIHEIKNADLINNVFINNVYKSKDMLIMLEMDASRSFMNETDRMKITTTSLLKEHITCIGWDAKSKELNDLKKLKRKIKESKKNDTSNLIKLLKKAFPKQEIDPNKFDIYIENLNIRLKKGIIETFQTRNNSLIATLKETSGIAKLRFVIAGRAHFLKSESKCPLIKKAYVTGEISLEPLINYLNSQKAVILTLK